MVVKPNGRLDAWRRGLKYIPGTSFETLPDGSATLKIDDDCMQRNIHHKELMEVISKQSIEVRSGLSSCLSFVFLSIF
jgi:hypothetical protein